MDWLFDERTQCWSLQTSLTIDDYIELVSEAHQTQGALTGQRDVLTTTTAKRIRSRMVADLRLGAVLPPVVIGAVVDGELFGAMPVKGAASVQEIIPKRDLQTLSISTGCSGPLRF